MQRAPDTIQQMKVLNVSHESLYHVYNMKQQEYLDHECNTMQKPRKSS
jgi:hypothetical protein